MAAADIAIKNRQEKLVGVEKFKKVLNKDKGKIKYEIETKKNELAMSVKEEHMSNLLKVMRQKEKDLQQNAKRKEAVNKVEREMKESIKKTIKKKADEIKESQEEELRAISNTLKAKRAKLAKVQKVWKAKASVSNGYIPQADTFERLLDATIDNPRVPKVRGIPKVFSLHDLTKIKRSINASIEPDENCP